MLRAARIAGIGGSRWRDILLRAVAIVFIHIHDVGAVGSHGLAYQNGGLVAAIICCSDRRKVVLRLATTHSLKRLIQRLLM